MENKTITVTELQKKLAQQEPVFILDVRPTEQREEWHIANSTHVDAYKQLNAGDNSVLDEVDISENVTVVTVCAAGRTSLLASEALRAKGANAYSLEGGMKAWNYAWNTAEANFPNNIKVIQVRRVAKGCLSHVIGSGNEAVVIDASLDPQVYLDIAKNYGWTIRYVTDTHIHADYLSRTRELAKASQTKHVLIDLVNVEYSFTPVKNGELIKFGNTALQLLHTPGHTVESVSFRLGDYAVFTGDTLFTDGVGRPDLKANQDEAVAKSKLLYHSLQQLVRLNPNTKVFPAHTYKAIRFDDVMIGEIIDTLKSKLDLLQLDEAEFVTYAMSRIPPAPPNYLTIASLNKQGSYEGYIPADLEAGANRCAIA